MTIEELKQRIGELAWSAPKSGKRLEAVTAILDHVKSEGGEALALQWLLSYLGDAGITEAGMRIVRQPEPPKVETLQIAGFYQHRKHDPDNGKQHQYQVVALVSPKAASEEILVYPTRVRALHTETGVEHSFVRSLVGNQWWSSPSVDAEHVLYQNIQGKLLWLRPLDLFMDGRFMRIDKPIS